MNSRRQFLIGSGQVVAALAVASGALTRSAGAETKGKHPGIQLYTINDANSIILRDGHCHNRGRLPARDPIYIALTPTSPIIAIMLS